MVIVQFHGCLVRQYRAYSLVLLILLGWELRVYYDSHCVPGILILSLLIFMPSVYSNFTFSCILSFFNHNS